MKQRPFAMTAHFPGHPRKGRDATAVLANFNNSGGGKLLKAGLQLSSKFHGSIISEVHGCRNMFSDLGERSVTVAILTAQKEPLDQRLGEMGGAHALLHQGNIVRHAPE